MLDYSNNDLIIDISFLVFGTNVHFVVNVLNDETRDTVRTFVATFVFISTGDLGQYVKYTKCKQTILSKCCV